jgi:hypothetical protein
LFFNEHSALHSPDALKAFFHSKTAVLDRLSRQAVFAPRTDARRSSIFAQRYGFEPYPVNRDFQGTEQNNGQTAIDIQVKCDELLPHEYMLFKAKVTVRVPGHTPHVRYFYEVLVNNLWNDGKFKHSVRMECLGSIYKNI